jgi:pimeloyl-ACP methyl ester carboxylesterase
MNRRNFLEASGTMFASALLAPAITACTRFNNTHEAAMSSSLPLDAAAFRRMRRFADTPYGRIAYVQRGNGRVALFLHAYPLNGFEWRGAIDRLSADYRCIAPDLMGLGYSEIHVEQRITPAAQVQMLVALLDALSIRQADVVANDSGGLIAQLLVAHHPERVRTLLLTNCDVEADCPPRSFLPFVKMARDGVLADKSIAPVLADKSLGRSPRGLNGLAYTNPLNPTDEAIDYYFTPLVSSPLRKEQLNALTVGLGDNALAGTEASLRKFPRPVRILWATADTVFAQSSPDWLDRTFPGSRGVRRIDGAKLFFPEEQPDLIAAEARELWKA